MEKSCAFNMALSDGEVARIVNVLGRLLVPTRPSK
jgi:hypothetical protein